MGHPPIEDLLPRANNSIYKLVKLAANRAVELADGRQKLIEISSSEKLATVALEEIREGKVILKEVVEQGILKEGKKEKKVQKAA